MTNNNRDILALALPAIVINITTPLLALMDVAVTGHMGSPVYIAAIAVGGSMFNMIYWLFGFLRMGSSGMAAQAYGRGDRHEASLLFQRAFVIAAVVGCLIIALKWPVSELVLSFTDCDEATVEPALRYFNICVWGAPAVLVTYVATGWLLGMQNSKAGMWISLLINLSNIVISLALVYGVGMKIEGVGTGTLSAQWLGAMMAMVMVSRYRLKLGRLSEIFDWKELKRFFSVNVFIFLRTLCIIAVTMWFTRVGSQQGNVMLAVNTLLMQLFILFSYFMDGFAYAAEALSGRYIGSRDHAGLIKMVRSLFKWGLGISVAFTVVYFVGGEELLGFLSDDHDVVSGAMEYLPWVIMIPLLSFTAFVWDGVFVGATATREMMVSMALSAAMFFALYFWLYPHLGNTGLWIAFMVYLLSRGLIQTMIYVRHRQSSAD